MHTAFVTGSVVNFNSTFRLEQASSSGSTPAKGWHSTANADFNHVLTLCSPARERARVQALLVDLAQRYRARPHIAA
jgi:hypothetical protein